MVNRNQKILLNKALEVCKIIGDKYSYIDIELKSFDLNLTIHDVGDSIDWEEGEPIIQYFIKSNTNWKIILNEFNALKINIWI